MSDPTQPHPSKQTYPTARPKVPPFARYRGTSAWRKYRRRVYAYALFKAAQAKQQATTAA